jgi:chemotaxis protein methyltransferase CheR
MTTTILNSGTFEFVRKLVLDKSAIVLQASKMYLIEARLAPIAKENGFADVKGLVDKIKATNNRSLVQQVIEAMTTNETSFYRDISPFDALKAVIVPELILKRQSERKLIVWSNACSSGQEVYSIAMLLRENFPELQGWDVKLIASDLSTQILEKARSGIFNQTEINRGLPPNLMQKYFLKQGVNFQIKDEIRKMVEFRVINLIESYPPMPKVDIVFLRNVLIYFDPQTKASILNKVRTVMRPDGYLFLGGAETTMGLDTDFKRLQVQKTVVYRAS